MSPQAPAMPAESKLALRAGYGLTVVVVLFLLLDAVMKLLAVAPVIEAMAQLGWPASAVAARALGALLLACTALYAFPRTSALGAILLTAYLGGAVAAHVRLGDPVFTHQLFGVYLGLFLWGGLYLRDSRIRALLPATR